jgi:hypothetical protein
MSKVRNHPVSSKYARVWQRAKVKIKTRLLLKYMMEDRILFGANIVSDEETDEKAIVAQIMKNKIEAAQNQVVVYPSRTYLMSPRNVLRVLWNIIYTIAVLEVGLVMPFRLAFLESDIDLSWLYFDSVVDFLFLIDIFLAAARHSLLLAYDTHPPSQLRPRCFLPHDPWATTQTVQTCEDTASHEDDSQHAEDGKH